MCPAIQYNNIWFLDNLFLKSVRPSFAATCYSWIHLRFANLFFFFNFYVDDPDT